jgi:orotidine-5'-phosphate decarboxylase
VVNPILVALDFPTSVEAERMARLVDPHVGGFKVGLELVTGQGPEAIRRIVQLGKPVFCDVKLHDIPNTVGAAARQLGRLGVRWLTVHASGGVAMVEAAVEGLAASSEGEAGVLAVTVLTSLGSNDLEAMGMHADPRAQVRRLAAVAQAAGAEGVVCSVAEVRAVAISAPSLTKVTPGIRPAGSVLGDQARVATPRIAIEAGADWIVVGRPVTRAADPAAAARAIAEEVDGVGVSVGSSGAS